MPGNDTIDRTFVRKGKIKKQGNDFLYWQLQPYEVRLAMVDKLRLEYNTWKYGAEQGFFRLVETLWY